MRWLPNFSPCKAAVVDGTIICPLPHFNRRFRHERYERTKGFFAPKPPKSWITNRNRALWASWLPYSSDTDFSSLDISICQLSRRWQPSLGGCKKFEPSLRPGKSSYGWFIFRIGIVHVGKGRYWRKNDKKKFEKPPKLVLFSLQAFHVWSEEQLAATVFLRRTATALFLSVLSILWPSWSMQFRYICNVITRTKCFFKTLLQIY